MHNRNPWRVVDPTWRVVDPKTALATVVIVVVFFQVLVAIGWIIGIIALLFRRSYCPICRTPGKLLQPQR